MPRTTRYGRMRSRRTGRGTQRRWGHRVRKQARKEIVKLAESKRDYVFNENWINPGPIGIADPAGDIFIANAFGFLGAGTGDPDYIGNEILDPFLVLRLQVSVLYNTLAASFNTIPTLRVSAYLVAINDQLATTVVPRLTSVAEDNTLFVKHPGSPSHFLWQFNSQNVTVIKKKTVMFMGTDVSGATPTKVKTMKLSKRLRGKKKFEQTITAGGALATQPYLKGWNYYWIVISQWSNGYIAASSTNPVIISGDRYVYFKDF
ncbi:capsid protein [Gopherus associated circular DNA virus 3]|nr:capsid protein [Gopherus associated circular DNA virus 3]